MYTDALLIRYMLTNPGCTAVDVCSYFNLSYPQFASAKARIIRGDLLLNYVDPVTKAPTPVAYRYDQSTYGYYLGSDAMGSSEADFRQFIQWSGGYTRTRAEGITHHLAAIQAAFPKRLSTVAGRNFRDVRRYADNMVAEVDAMLARL